MALSLTAALRRRLAEPRFGEAFVFEPIKGGVDRSDRHDAAPLRFESRRIVELCQAPMSIADLSVALRVPLGVVRVIVADLVTEGYLRIEEQLGELPIALIERIRDRVRAL